MNKELMDYYQVTWIGPNGQKLYGVVNRYDTEAELAYKDGYLIVSDAILPVVERVALAAVKKLPMDFGGEYDQYVEAEHKKAMATSDAVQGFGVGKLFSLGVGDGSAWYVITKVGKKNVTVEWRGFCMDRWTDQLLGWGGSFPRRSIEPLCLRKWSELGWR